SSWVDLLYLRLPTGEKSRRSRNERVIPPGASADLRATGISTRPKAIEPFQMSREDFDSSWGSDAGARRGARRRLDGVAMGRTSPLGSRGSMRSPGRGEGPGSA